MWLRDDIAFDFPRARVVIYGYETTLAGSQSFQDLDALAITFRTALKTIRPDTMVSHSNLKNSLAANIYTLRTVDLMKNPFSLSPIALAV